MMFSLPIPVRACNNAFREEVRCETSNVFSRRFPDNNDLFGSAWHLGVRPRDVNRAVRQS